jgi:DNA-binding MarR family transcriptional regulator
MTGMNKVAGIDINLPEFLLLKRISKTDSEDNSCLLNIQNSQHISKSGVSKMLGTLEKKGYIIRETDKNNRRKIIITLTTKGYKAIEHLDNIINDYLTEYINAVGEDYLKQFFEIINHLYQVNENVMEKMLYKYFEANPERRNKHPSYTS